MDLEGRGRGRGGGGGNMPRQPLFLDARGKVPPSACPGEKKKELGGASCCPASLRSLTHLGEEEKDDFEQTELVDNSAAAQIRRMRVGEGVSWVRWWCAPGERITGEPRGPAKQDIKT